MRWFVVCTQPLKETVAKQHLEEQGYDVYLPMFKKLDGMRGEQMKYCSRYFLDIYL